MWMITIIIAIDRYPAHHRCLYWGPNLSLSTATKMLTLTKGYIEKTTSSQNYYSAQCSGPVMPTGHHRLLWGVLWRKQIVCRQTPPSSLGRLVDHLHPHPHPPISSLCGCGCNLVHINAACNSLHWYFFSALFILSKNWGQGGVASRSKVQETCV